MTMKRNSVAAAVSLALASWSLATHAQSQRGAMEEVVVHSSRLDASAETSSRVDLSPLETPASIHVLDRETILERGDFTVQDAVSRMPGVVDEGSSGNGGTSLSARGFSGVNSVMRLYDGVQMFVAAGTMTFPYDTWTVERIEVLGGPSSSLYGTGAIGGIVNVIPRRPNRDAFEHNYRLSAGSNGTLRAGIDSTGPVSERVSYRVSASRQQSDGYADRADSESWALSAALRIDVSPTLSITVTEDYGDQRPATNSSIPLIDGEFDESLQRMNYNVLDAERRYEDSWTQVKVDWSPSDRLAVRSSTYYLTAERLWFGAGSATYQPDTGLLRRTGGSDLSHDLRQYGQSTTVTLTGELFGRPNTAAMGFDFNRLRFDHVYWVSQATTFLDPYTPDLGYFQYLPGNYSYINRFHANQYALFAENLLELTPRLSLLAGVRTDHYDVDRFERLTDVGSAASFNPTSWRIGLLHRIAPGFTVYGNYSTATDPAGSVGNMSASAQRMEMMKGKQLEVGVKRAFADGRGEWTAAAYRIVKNNLQIPVPDEPGVTQQVGQQSSTGLELSASLRLTQTLRLDANAAILDARFDDFAENVGGVFTNRKGNTPRGVAEETANLWVHWTPAPRWHTRVGVRYVGERYSDNANSSTLDAYTVVDSGVRFELSERSLVDLRVFNALDRFYVPRGGTATAWSPAPLRTAELSFSSSF